MGRQKLWHFVVIWLPWSGALELAPVSHLGDYYEPGSQPARRNVAMQHRRRRHRRRRLTSAVVSAPEATSPWQAVLDRSRGSFRSTFAAGDYHGLVARRSGVVGPVACVR